MPASLAQQSGPSFDGSAHLVGNFARLGSEDRPARASSTVSESAYSIPMTQAPCMKHGRKNMVPYTRSPRPWGVRGSSCVIPRQSYTFIPRIRGHILRPRSHSKCSLFTCVYVDDVRVVHVADAWIEFGKEGLLTAHGDNHKRYIHNLRRPRMGVLTEFARQRRSLTPAFSVTAIRELTSIFYDSAYKVRCSPYG